MGQEEGRTTELPLSPHHVPMVWVAVGLGSGIFVADRSGWPWWIWAIGFGISWLGFALWHRMRRWFLVGAIFGAGGFCFHLAVDPWSPMDLRRVVPQTPVLAQVEGVVVSLQTKYAVSPSGPSKPSSKAQLIVRSTRLTLRHTTQPVCGLLRVELRTIPAALTEGSRVRITGVLDRPAPAPLPGLFDERAYLQRKGIYFVLRANRPDDLEILDRAPPSWGRRFREAARRWLSFGLPPEDPILPFLRAMILGERSALSYASFDPFRKSGTMHLFAISGLHIGCVVLILRILFRALQMPHRMAWLAACGVAWLYTAWTGWQISATRASIMASALVGSYVLKQPPNLLNAWGLAAVLILLWQPQQLFQPGFQLSFSVVGALILGFGLWQRRLTEMRLANQWIPARYLPAWRRVLRKVGFGVGSWLGASVFCWLASWPWTAWYFHLFTPAAVLINGVVPVLALITVAGALGTLLVGGWWPGLAGLFNNAAWLGLYVVFWAGSTLEKWPWTWWRVQRPSILWVLLYFWILGLGLTGRRPWRRPWVWGSVFGLVLALGQTAGHIWKTHHTVRLTVLAEPDGGAVWIDGPGMRNDFLFDAGNRRQALRFVAAYLESQGINRLSALVLSHGDAQHVGGAMAVEEMFHPRRIFVSTVRQRSPYYRRFLETVQKAGSKRIHFVHTGDLLCGWQVLHPPAGWHAQRADDAVLVLYRTVGPVGILLLGDLSRTGQQALLKALGERKAGLVLAGLPRDDSGVEEALLARLHPQVVLLMDDAWNRAPKTLAAWQAAARRWGFRLLRTHGHTAYQITVSRHRMEVRFWTSQGKTQQLSVQAGS